MAVNWVILGVILTMIWGFGAFIFSVFVYFKVDDKDSDYKSHRADLKDQTQRIETKVDKVIEDFDEEGDEEIDDGMEEFLTDFRDWMSNELPTLLQAKLAGSMGGIKKAENARVEALYEGLDGMLKAEIIAKTTQNPFLQVLLDKAAGEPELWYYTEKWLISKGVLTASAEEMTALDMNKMPKAIVDGKVITIDDVITV